MMRRLRMIVEVGAEMREWFVGGREEKKEAA